jgi:hypothetical protein
LDRYGSQDGHSEIDWAAGTAAAREARLPAAAVIKKARLADTQPQTAANRGYLPRCVTAGRRIDTAGGYAAVLVHCRYGRAAGKTRKKMSKKRE